MKYINLGRTGLRVSRLCLGTMNFGRQTNEPDSFSIMDKALDLGFNFLIRLMFTGVNQGRVSRRRSLDGGWRKVVNVAKE